MPTHRTDPQPWQGTAHSPTLPSNFHPHQLGALFGTETSFLAKGCGHGEQKKSQEKSGLQ